MANVELAGTLKALMEERAQLEKQAAKLDRAIAVLRTLSSGRPSANGHVKRRTLSPAARRKIAKAQKLRWAKVKQAKAAKSQ